MKNPKVSVIIPAYNTGEFIEECLISLKNQTFKDFEIIVIDDASRDRTSQIAQKYNVTVIKNEKKLGEGASRNIGAKIAHGEILVHTDADVVMPVTWLGKIVNNLKNREIKAVAGGYCDSIGKSFIEQFACLELNFRRKDFAGFVNTAVSNNFACYRDIFFEHGGFPEKYKCEDMRLSFKISKKYPIYWDKENGIYHHFRNSIKAYLKQQFHFAKDTVWTYYSCPEMLFRKTHQGKSIYLETLLIFFAIFLFPLLPVFLLLILIINYQFLKFLKNKEIPVIKSIGVILARDAVCAFAILVGIGICTQDIVKRIILRG